MLSPLNSSKLINSVMSPSILILFADELQPQVAKDGIPLPPDRTLCPLCCQKRANPSVLAVSGFVFCYSCIFKYVSQVKSLNFLTYSPLNGMHIFSSPSSLPFLMWFLLLFFFFFGLSSIKDALLH